MERHYYHVTTVDNAKKIFKEGLKANDGKIFMFLNKSFTHPVECVVCAADEIAKNQCFIQDEYAMLEIDSKGIEGEPIEDCVGEIASYCHLQWYVNQAKIQPQFIN